MDNIYIQELLSLINSVEFWNKTEKRYSNYNAGISALLDLFTKHKIDGNQLFFIGNGGSAAIAEHMTVDYMKNGGMKTYSLYDSAVTTCMGNDYGYENIFSKPLEFLMQKADLLVAISSSGNSANIRNAVSVAKKKGAGVITFTGFKSDNCIKQMGDINVYVPSGKYGMVESIHNIILQQIVDMIMVRDGVRV